jgi:hypothetical protein
MPPTFTSKYFKTCGGCGSFKTQDFYFVKVFCISSIKKTKDFRRGGAKLPQALPLTERSEKA